MQNSQSQSTKLVRINIEQVLTIHQCFTEVLEVPVGMSTEEMQVLADRRYDDLARSEYSEVKQDFDNVSIQCFEAEDGAAAAKQLIGDDLVSLHSGADQVGDHGLLTESVPCKGHAGAGLPIVVIEVEGGLIQAMRSSLPVEIITVDTDVEGAEQTDDFMGEKAVVTYAVLDTPSVDGHAGLDPEFCTEAQSVALALVAEHN